MPFSRVTCATIAGCSSRNQRLTSDGRCSWDDHFPKHGDAWASARRKDNPLLQLLYSFGFWAVVLIALLSFILSSVGSR